MQEQVRRIEEELALHQADNARLRTQVLGQIDELNETRASHAERLRERDRTIVDRDDLIAQLRAHSLVSEKNVRDHQENIRTYQRLLSEAQAQLSRHVEVLNWIYASRSWRISRTLRLVDRLNERRPRPRAIFSGQLELPHSVVFDVLEIRGWVYSNAAPVMLVEAFLDDFYLGSVRYGEKRPEISGAPLECGYSDRISLHGFSITGEKTLRVRVFDQKGNRQAYTRRLIVAPASQAAVEPSIPLEIFRGTLELPQPEAVLSDSVEIRGWAYSKAGSIVHIEAFFNDSYLGRIGYGQERPDVFAAIVREFVERQRDAAA